MASGRIDFSLVLALVLLRLFVTYQSDRIIFEPIDSGRNAFKHLRLLLSDLFCMAGYNYLYADTMTVRQLALHRVRLLRTKALAWAMPAWPFERNSTPIFCCSTELLRRRPVFVMILYQPLTRTQADT